ncbi:hypothetical protein [Streptomyces coeruleorubidus]|uniref:hypothetical protein n=1 Tax=Streptomyces coeruleorubidus TaxID=116188 RepID=UPI0036B08507
MLARRPPWLLDDHARTLDWLPQPPSSYPCAMFDWAEMRRQESEVVRSWLVEPELHWYDQQLRDEEEAEHRRRVAWVVLTDAELDEPQQQARSAAGVHGDLRSMRAACVARAGSADEVGH